MSFPPQLKTTWLTFFYFLSASRGLKFLLNSGKGSPTLSLKSFEIEGKHPINTSSVVNPSAA